MIKAFFAFTCFLLSLRAQAATETNFRSDTLFVVDQRWTNAPGIAQHDHLNDGIFIGGIDFSGQNQNFIFEIRPELRALFSESAESALNSVEYINLKGPTRFLHLTSRLESSSRSDSYLDFQKLAISYRNENSDVLIGRKIFSTGVLKIFPVWNKFSRPLFFIPSPVLLYGQDQATISLQTGIFSVRVAYLPEDISSEDTKWLELAALPANYELHFLVASWWQKNVLGLSAATDLAGATVRAETLFVSPYSEDPARQFQMGLGCERSLGSKWTLLIEGYFQDHSVDDSQYQLIPPTQFSQLQAKYYSATQLSYQFSETVLASLASLSNFNDQSSYLDFKVDDSLTGNSDLIFEAKGPVTRTGELSSAAINYPNGSHIGIPSQLSLAYKRFF